MRDWPLGAKLTAWSTLVVGIALLICGVGAVLFIQREQIQALDDQLRNEAHTFFAEVARQEGTLDWSSYAKVRAILPVTRTERFIRIVGPDKRVLFDAKGTRLSSADRLPPGMHTLKVNRGPVRVGVFAQSHLTLYLGAALSEINADETELLVGLLVGLPLLVATVAGGGWWLARKALAPIRDITAATERITADRLGQRLTVPPARDEIGHLAEVLNAMFDRLEKSFHQAMRFSADASHELKTPLTILRNSVEDLLKSPSLATEDQRTASALLEQIRHLSSITESLLLLSRADAGRLKLNFADTDLCEIITACADDTGIMAEERGISIETQLPETLMASVDEGRVMQILLNLLDNAVKYGNQGGQIRIGAEEREDGAICIRVANTGEEIPREKSSEIFGRFFRLGENVSAHGHGLGLSIARELTRAHGGDLTLEQSDGDWTIFAAILPPGLKR